MNLSPQTVRNHIPLPQNHSKLVAWVLFGLGSVWLFDVYSKNSDGMWPITSIFPWQVWMYMNVKYAHVVAFIAVYGLYKFGRIIWQEQELRLSAVEASVRELAMAK